MLYALAAARAVMNTYIAIKANESCSSECQAWASQLPERVSHWRHYETETSAHAERLRWHGNAALSVSVTLLHCSLALPQRLN